MILEPRREIVRPSFDDVMRCSPFGGGLALARPPKILSGPPLFDPATLALTGWWRADYSGAPWAGNASAGISGATGALVHSSTDPVAGTTQNGRTPADFAGAHNLANTADATTLYSTGHGSIVCLFYAVSAGAPSGIFYDDVCFIRDNNADVLMSWTTSGVGAVAYSTGYKTKYIACGTGAYHLAMMRWDSANLGLTIDSAAEQTTACPALTVMTGSCAVGQGYGGGFFNGRILELMTTNITLSPTNYSNIKSYVNGRYALAL